MTSCPSIGKHLHQAAGSQFVVVAVGAEDDDSQFLGIGAAGIVGRRLVLREAGRRNDAEYVKRE